jgi:hypothetical protein
MDPIISAAVTAVNTAPLIHEVSGLVSNATMKTIDEIRHANLLALIEQAGGEKAGPAALAAKYACDESYIKQLRAQYKDSKSGTPKEIGNKTARRLEDCMEKERGWMDNDHSIRPYGITRSGATSFVADRFSDDGLLDELLDHFYRMSKDGRLRLLGQAEILAAQHPAAAANGTR